MITLNKNVKKIIAAALVSALFTGMSVSTVFASPKYVKITGNPVAVREDAGTSAKFIKQVHNGNQLIYVSEKNADNDVRWYQVKLSDGAIGWVTSVYSETIDEKYVGKVEVHTKLLNIRSEASLTSEILGTTKMGSQFDYFSVAKDSSNQLWYLVQYNSEQTAWLLGTYCKVIKEISKSDNKTDNKTDNKKDTSNSAKSVEITATPVNVRDKGSIAGNKIGKTYKGQTYEYLASGIDEKGQLWYKIQFTSEKAGWVLSTLSKIVNSESKADNKTDNKTDNKKETKQIEITQSPVNVRTSASTSSKKLGTTSKGKKYTLLATKKDSKKRTWYQIQFTKDQKGWVLGTLAKEITSDTKTDTKTETKMLEITQSPVNVRTSASTSSKKLGTTSKGKKYTYLATQKDSNDKIWYQIQYTKDIKGWVLGSFVKTVSA